MIKKVLVFFAVVISCFLVMLYFMVNSDDIDFQNSAANMSDADRQKITENIRSGEFFLVKNLDTLVASKSSPLVVYQNDTVLFDRNVNSFFRTVSKIMIDHNHYILNFHVFYDLNESKEIGLGRSKKLIDVFTKQGFSLKRIKTLVLQKNLIFNQENQSKNAIEVYITDNGESI